MDALLVPLALTITVYIACTTVYRLYFHPLASILGPTLACVSRLYEFWWGCVRLGRYAFEIEKIPCLELRLSSSSSSSRL